MRTTLVVLLAVVTYAMAVTLAISVFGSQLDGFAESWVLGALFSSGLLFWSLVLVTGLALASVIVAAWRILNAKCVAFRRDG